MSELHSQEFAKTPARERTCPMPEIGTEVNPSPPPRQRPHVALWPSDESMRHICNGVARVLVAVVTTRNTVPFGMLLALCIIAWRLPDQGIERIITLLITARW